MAQEILRIKLQTVCSDYSTIELEISNRKVRRKFLKFKIKSNTSKLPIDGKVYQTENYTIF